MWENLCYNQILNLRIPRLVYKKVKLIPIFVFQIFVRASPQVVKVIICDNYQLVLTSEIFSGVSEMFLKLDYVFAPQIKS